MSSEYNYDADAQFFPFFVLTITSLITLPLTYTLLRKSSDSATTSKTSQIVSSYKPEHADIIDAQRAKQKRKELRLKRILTAATGWFVMGYMVYLVYVTARTVPKIWNPYEILEVALSATEKQINSRYRRLSVTMHPDKRTPNPAKNETMETVNDEWVEIVKAYKALTDEDVRNNFIQYGHPDGKQSTSFGIALPQFLIAQGSGKYVLIMYAGLLGIGLPWLVGKWWYGMQKMTKERILVTSAGNMFKEYKERMDGAEVIEAVSTAAEYKDILHGSKAESGLSKVEQKVLAKELPENVTERLQELEDPVRRKTFALAWAYLTRTDLDDRTLEAEKFELAPTLLQLNEAFGAMALAFGWTSPVMGSFRLSQSLVQAVSPHEQMPLLQLPHFTPEIVRSIEIKASPQKQHLTIQSFMALPTEQRQALAQAAGLTKDRLQVAEGVARQLPYLHVEKAFFKVQGEKYIIPSSLVQYVVKARFIPPGTQNVPPVKADDLLDIDPPESDLKAQKEEPEQHPLPLAHAPFFPKDRAPRWHIFLVDDRQGKIAVPPFRFDAFTAAPFDADGKPTFAVVTLRMQFQAPPQAGEFRFRAQLVCDSYLGFDDKRDAVLVVEDATKAVEVDDDDDISEPDEDSIAGQMAALKGQQPAKPAGRTKVAKKADDDSDYESNTDEDEDSESETDTDTDSDEE